MVKYNRKLLSRAKWRGSLYLRQRSGTWRKYGGKKDGQIYYGDNKRPSGEITGEFERTYDNFYSRDKTRPRKAIKK
jgi:hypothetical protein